MWWKIIVILSIWAALFLVANLPWFLFPLRGYNSLDYSDGINFIGTSGKPYRKVTWNCKDGDCSKPCPLSVQLALGELLPEFLSDENKLRQAGWIEFFTGNEIELSTPGKIVSCRFQNSKLTHVEVNSDVAAEKGINSVTISISGKQISLPASENEIERVFGKWKKRN